MMLETARNIYDDMAKRTNGDIYIGVVGPVRTGKSTFVKRFMELLVIPNIENIYQKERAKDELPQSGSGKTIMTCEPKFVPEDAICISPNGKSKLSVRLIDSVGYIVPDVSGILEDGKPRMVTTPWLPEEIPITEAAELGTQKVMDTHATVGIIVTTDGSVTDLPRESYIDAERKAIEDMKATGKPFIILINTADPTADTIKILKKELSEKYHVTSYAADLAKMDEEELKKILTCILSKFPIKEFHFTLPRWLDALEVNHPIKQQIYEWILDISRSVECIEAVESDFAAAKPKEIVEMTKVLRNDLGSGIVYLEIWIPRACFYSIIREQTGFDTSDDAELLFLLKELSFVKKNYEKVEAALNQVHATGYGIVMPSPEEMCLEIPQIVRKGSNFGVKLKASAPSIHMLRADIETEISPIVGDEKQSEDLLQYLLQEYDENTAKLWDSNIFGKSVFELVNEGLGAKLKKMPEQSRSKLQTTLSRIINEGSSGLLCIILS